MILSRSVHVAINGITSFFLWLSQIPLSIYTLLSVCEGRCSPTDFMQGDDLVEVAGVLALRRGALTSVRMKKREKGSMLNRRNKSESPG